MPAIIALIPALNEADGLPAVLAALQRSAPDYEVVVIDDGSTDATADVARCAGATVLRHAVNLGYGAALQTGYKYALAREASIVVQLDADGQHDPSQLSVLVEPIRQGNVDLVIGSRFVESTGYRMGPLRTIGRRLFQHVANLAGLQITDPTSGFQALNRDVLSLYVRDFFPADYPDVDVLLSAHRHGLRIRELPVSMHPEARRSRLHGGLRTFYYVLKMGLSLWAGTRTRKRRSAPPPE